MKKPKIKIALRRTDGKMAFARVNRSESYEQGTMYHYKIDGRLESCATLKDYKMEYFNGFHYVGQIEGNQTAVALLGNPDPDAPGENYALLLRTHLYAEGHKTLVGGISIPWGWVLAILGILIVVIIGVFVVRSQFSHNDAAGSGATPVPGQQQKPQPGVTGLGG